MANITVNTTSAGSSGSSPLTISHTVNSFGNRKLVVSVMSRATAPPVLSVTYNGVAMTSGISASLGGLMSEIFYLDNADYGAHDVVVTTAAGGLQYIAAGVVDFYFAKQGALDATATETGDIEDPDISITTTVDNCIIVDAFTDQAEGGTQGVNFGSTEITRPNVGSDAQGAAYRAIASASAQSMGWATSSTDPYAICAISVATDEPKGSVSSVFF